MVIFIASGNEIHSEVVAVSGVCHGEMQTPRSEVLTVEKEAVRCVNVCQFSLCTQFELEISLHCLGKQDPGFLHLGWYLLEGEEEYGFRLHHI